MCATAACSYFHLEDAYQKVLQQIEENAEFQTRLNETDKWTNEWMNEHKKFITIEREKN